MWKAKIAKMAGYAVALWGMLVVFGWVFDIDWLKTPSPQIISMKFLTAVSFVLSGFVLIMIAKLSVNEDSSGLFAIILPILSLIIMLIMATIFFSVVAGFDLGFVNAIIKEEPGAIGTVYSVGLGMPSISTMVGFIFIALAGLVAPLSFCRKNFYFTLFGVVAAIIGGIAVIGYVINIPILFYYVPGKSSAIAINTALLFVIWGLGMIILCYRGKNDANSK